MYFTDSGVGGLINGVFGSGDKIIFLPSFTSFIFSLPFDIEKAGPEKVEKLMLFFVLSGCTYQCMEGFCAGALMGKAELFYIDLMELEEPGITTVGLTLF